MRHEQSESKDITLRRYLGSALVISSNMKEHSLEASRSETRSLCVSPKGNRREGKEATIFLRGALAEENPCRAEKLGMVSAHV